MAEPIVVGADELVKTPDGHLWAWYADARKFVDLSAEAPASPEQAVRNFQVANARYRGQVFTNRAGGSYPEVTICGPELTDLRRALRAVLIGLLADKPGNLHVQYNVWDFLESKWIDPSTGNELPAGFQVGLMNAGLKLEGGFGDLL